MTLHHAVSVIILGLTISSRHSAHLILGGMFIGEISNPSMHFSAMLKLVGLRYCKLYEFCEISFAVLYCAGRVFMGSIQLIRIFNCEGCHVILKVSTLALAIQSYYFVFNMVPLIRDRFETIASRKRLKITAYWLTPLPLKALKQLNIDPTKVEKFVL